MLALAYLLTIIYASLQPFRGWRLPPEDLYGFLTAAWPRYITLEDVLANAAAYMPLGFMLALGLRPFCRPVLSVIAGALLAAMVSTGMESMQLFLPARIPSNIDVLANSTGGLIGALAAPLFSPSQLIGARLIAWRDRVFRAGALTETGLLIAVLWVITQLNPVTQMFGTGNLRATFDLPVYFFHTPGLLLTAEAAVVFFNLLGLGLMLSTLLRQDARRGAVIAGFIITAILLKILITAVFSKSQGAFAWMTPGVMVGLSMGVMVLLVGVLSFGHQARLWLSILCVLLALAAINLAPDNPYFNMPPQLASGRVSHLLSFSAILRALSELWPLLALAYLITLSRQGRRSPGSL
ncbi:MAG: VanZ family protein [Burkholderiales bacterium]